MAKRKKRADVPQREHATGKIHDEQVSYSPTPMEDAES